MDQKFTNYLKSGTHIVALNLKEISMNYLWKKMDILPLVL